MSSLKICFICNEYPPAPHGGIGTVTRTLARELVRAGHLVKVVGIAGSGAAHHEIDEGVDVFRLAASHSRRFSWLASRYSVYKQVSAWARVGEIDLIEAPDYEGWTAGWPHLRLPVIVRLHGSASYFAHESRLRISRLTFHLEKRALKSACFCCSVSRYTSEKTRALFNLKRFEPAILYNPVSVCEVCNWSPVPMRVIFTGTLTPKKGVLSLIAAWPRVVQANPAARLHLYGRDGKSPLGGSMREYLAAMLPDEARQSVTFHGAVPHTTVIDALRTANVAIFPSFSEAFAMAPMESMALGCPTIYSTRSSGPELITHGKDGLLVDPDNPEQISEAILAVLQDTDLAKQLGAAGRERIKTAFSIKITIEKNLAFYRDCLMSHKEKCGRQ